MVEHPPHGLGGVAPHADHLLHLLDQASDLPGRLGRALRQRADFAGHHRETSRLSCAQAGCFDRRVERQKVGLVGDLVDQLQGGVQARAPPGRWRRSPRSCRARCGAPARSRSRVGRRLLEALAGPGGDLGHGRLSAVSAREAMCSMLLAWLWAPMARVPDSLSISLTRWSRLITDTCTISSVMRSRREERRKWSVTKFSSSRRRLARTEVQAARPISASPAGRYRV